MVTWYILSVSPSQPDTHEVLTLSFLIYCYEEAEAVQEKQVV